MDKIPFDRCNEQNLFIAGQTGIGKTYFAKNILLPYILEHDKRQIIILDVKETEFDLGFIVSINAFQKIEDYAECSLGFWCKNKKRPRIITIKCKRFRMEQIELLFHYLCESYDKILIFDEASFYLKEYKHGRIPLYTNEFYRITTLSHNRRNNSILITQYPNDIPTEIIGSHQRGFLFYLYPKQIKYLSDANWIPNDKEFYQWDTTDLPISARGKFYEIPSNKVYSLKDNSILNEKPIDNIEKDKKVKN